MFQHGKKQKPKYNNLLSRLFIQEQRKSKTENLLPKLLAQKNIEVLNSKTYVTLFLSKFFNLCMGKPPSLILLLCVQPFGSKGKGYLLDQRGRSSLAKGAGDP